MQAVGQAVYAAGQAGAGPSAEGQPGQEGGQQTGQSGTVEGEFREV